MSTQSFKKKIYSLSGFVLSAFLVLSLAWSFSGCKKDKDQNDNNMLLLMLLGMGSETSWYTMLGGAGYDNANSIQQTADGGYIAAGNVNAEVPAMQGKTPIIPYAAGNDYDLMITRIDTSGNVTWYTIIGGTGEDNASSVQQTSDGGFIVAGSARADIPNLQGIAPRNSYSSSRDILIIKLSSNGNVSWYTFLGGTGVDHASSIQQTGDGGFILAGRADENIPNINSVTPINPYTGGNSSDCLMAKLDSNGTVTWYTFFGGTGWDSTNDIRQTSDGGFIIAGSADANIASAQGKTPVNAFSAMTDMLLVKLDTTGNVSWYTFLGGARPDYSSSVRQTSDGGFIAAGSANANIPSLQGITPLNAYSADYDMLAVKLDPNGSVSWYTFLGGAGTDYAGSVQQASDGGFIIAGRAEADITSLQTKTPLNAYSAAADTLLVKLDSGGSVDWYTLLGGAGTDYAGSVQQTMDGGFILAGRTGADIPAMQGKTPVNPYSGDYDMIIIKLKRDGSL